MKVKVMLPRGKSPSKVILISKAPARRAVIIVKSALYIKYQMPSFTLGSFPLTESQVKLS